VFVLHNILFETKIIHFAYNKVMVSDERKYLPVPGGPYRRTPFQGARTPENNSGYFVG
jgi:hypothetical protein